MNVYMNARRCMLVDHYCICWTHQYANNERYIPSRKLKHIFNVPHMSVGERTNMWEGEWDEEWSDEGQANKSNKVTKRSRQRVQDKGFEAEGCRWGRTWREQERKFLKHHRKRLISAGKQQHKDKRSFSPSSKTPNAKPWRHSLVNLGASVEMAFRIDRKKQKWAHENGEDSRILGANHQFFYSLNFHTHKRVAPTFFRYPSLTPSPFLK